jgi:hypothetical protein
MSRFRFYLLWCAILAIPIQGFASTSMLVCGPRHAQMAAAESHSPAHESGAKHDHARHDHATAAPEDRAEGATDGGSFLKIVKIKCLACAACGAVSATAPAPSVPSLAITRAQGAPIAFLSVSYAGIVPAGLERPPRTIAS